MKNNIITLRAHHGMCLTFFQGKGYNDKFVEHMINVQNSLQQDAYVKVVCYNDEICSACPNQKNNICDNSDLVIYYDNAVLKLCSLKEGIVMPYSEFNELIKSCIIKKNLRRTICGNCQWDKFCI